VNAHRIYRHLVRGVVTVDESFLRPAFRVATGPAREHLNRIAESFLHGYRYVNSGIERAGLVHNDFSKLAPEYQMFAYEGAGLALTLAQFLLRSDIADEWFVRSSFSRLYLSLCLGAGWASPWIALERIRDYVSTHVLQTWAQYLLLTGAGTQRAYFHWLRYVDDQWVPVGMTREEQTCFDVGIGRMIWAGEGADVQRAAERAATFVPDRQRDIWSGIGLGCAQIGPVGASDVKYLGDASGPYHAWLAEGIVVAASMCDPALPRPRQTGLACEIICRMTCEEAARWAESTLIETRNGDSRTVQAWRSHLRSIF
jgi:enediyne biosynthesis protein E3